MFRKIVQIAIVVGSWPKTNGTMGSLIEIIFGAATVVFSCE